MGAPRSSSITTGVGMGITPCSVFTMPMPVGTDDEKTRSTPSIESATAVPVMSTIESTAPASWNVTCSTSRRCTRASASPRRRKMRWASASASAGSFASSSSERMFAYVRMTPVAAARTVTLVAWIPCVSTCSKSTSNGSIGSSSRRSRTASGSAPASISAPRAMSPEIPETQSKYRTLMAAPSYTSLPARQLQVDGPFGPEGTVR